MKLLMLGLAMGQVLAIAPHGVCQEKQPPPNRPYLKHTDAPLLHFSIPPTDSMGRVVLTASSAERDLSAPLDLSSAEIGSILKLRGRVEVRMCSPGWHGCDKGSMVVHADAVDYNDRTHEIDAHGDVRIEPYQSEPTRANRTGP
jgi:hypothetical protein